MIISFILSFIDWGDRYCLLGYIRKSLFLFGAVFLLSVSASAQYYYKGEVTDQNKKGLPFVQIRLHSANQFFFTGSSGGFGFPYRQAGDSATFSLDGFEDVTVFLDYRNFFTIQLIPSPSRKIKKQTGLLSIVKNKSEEYDGFKFEAGETYSRLAENDVTSSRDFPSIAFSLNIDKASYSNIRRFINNRSIVPYDAVRIEEMLNYFPQADKKITEDSIFHFESQVTPCPWNNAHRLLFMQIQAKKVNFDHLPASHLVLLIDVSGSMDMPNRLPLLKTAFRMLVNSLRECDTLSIITYGGSVTVALRPTAGNEKEKILKVIEELSPGGETPGESALNAAYEYARANFIKLGINRIILATDGDFNVGQYTEKALMDLVDTKKKMGIYLTCLGVGMGNYKDSKLEVMAKKGNGNFAYIDNVKEGEKILVKELMQTLYVVANNAYLNTDFDTSVVKNYRLIGYDNPIISDVYSEKVLEGGEIGTGHTVTAIFEIEHHAGMIVVDAPLCKVELGYQLSDTGNVIKKEYNCLNNYQTFEKLDSSYLFLSSVAEFGMLLRNSKHLNKGNWDDLQQQVARSARLNDFWQSEFMQIVQHASNIYQVGKKKKKKAIFRKKE
jgi:Ca-activated chloride channel family protein